MRTITRVVLVIVLGMGGIGCATSASHRSGDVSLNGDTPSRKVNIADLAGTWEYIEGDVVYAVTLDRQGQGAYDWQGGRFITTSVSDGIWKGRWAQDDNDREGLFELRLRSDLLAAAGRWWYTRIGSDRSPLEPGGVFELRRLTTGFQP